MAYVTAVEIQSEFKNLVFTDPNGALVTEEVEEFIDQEESVINATISNRYETPVTDTESVNVLKRITTAFVAYRVAKILNLKKDVPIPEKLVAQDLSEGASYFSNKKLLESIKDGKVVLRGATARSLEQGVKSYNATNDISPKWQRDIKQW